MEFHQNSTVIPDIYIWNASGIPVEYYFEIPVFFLEGYQNVQCVAVKNQDLLKIKKQKGLLSNLGIRTPLS